MSFKQAWLDLWHVFLVMGIITVALYFSKGTITGSINAEITRVPANILVEKSQSYVLSLQDYNILELKSFSVSGEVVGSGGVRIYLDNGNGIKRLVYSNAGGAGKSMDVQSEFGEAKQPNAQLVAVKYRDLDFGYEGESSVETVSGSFRRACIETCELDSSLFSSARYELLFYVDAGASVWISEILYE